jgi:hypothetical protein
MQVLDRQAIRLRVFERGAGETLACGTGACAAVVAGISRGLLDSPVRVDDARRHAYDCLAASAPRADDRPGSHRIQGRNRSMKSERSRSTCTAIHSFSKSTRT